MAARTRRKTQLSLLLICRKSWQHLATAYVGVSNIELHGFTDVRNPDHNSLDRNKSCRAPTRSPSPVPEEAGPDSSVPASPRPTTPDMWELTQRDEQSPRREGDDVRTPSPPRSSPNQSSFPSPSLPPVIPLWQERGVERKVPVPKEPPTHPADISIDPGNVLVPNSDTSMSQSQSQSQKHPDSERHSSQPHPLSKQPFLEASSSPPRSHDKHSVIRRKRGALDLDSDSDDYADSERSPARLPNRQEDSTGRSEHGRLKDDTSSSVHAHAIGLPDDGDDPAQMRPVTPSLGRSTSLCVIGTLLMST
jgi:hypothetical protein